MRHSCGVSSSTSSASCRRSEEYQRFMNSKAPNKREQLVDELLGRKEFVELWVMKWAELLQIKSSNQVSYKAMLLYYNWLQDKIANNVPVDQMGAGAARRPRAAPSRIRPPTTTRTRPTR